MTSPVLRIGSRGSPLALKQAEIVRTALIAAHPELAEPGTIDIVPIRTTGDRIQDRTLAEAGGVERPVARRTIANQHLM